MRISRVLIDGELVRCAAEEGVTFEPVEELGGEPVEGVSIAHLPFAEHGSVHLVRIAVGGGLPLHTGPESGFVQVIEGAGTLVLPGDVRVPYEAAQLFLFAPETLHGWTDVTADTLMAACLIT